MSPKQKNGSVATQDTLANNELLKLEAKYCSWGDTVHYMENPPLFKRSEGNYLYDAIRT